MTKKIILFLIPVVSAGLFLPGCGEKEIVIIKIPTFYKGDIKSVAIIPFRNASGAPNAGNIVSDALAAMLVVNGTYKVINRNDHRILQDEQDLRTEAGLSNAQIAAKFRNIADVDAILVGTVSTYAATKHDDPRVEQIPIWQYNAYTKQMYIAGYNTRRYTFTRNEGNVTASAALIRVSDGTTIHATLTPIRGHFWAQGSPPQYDPNACLNEATNWLIVKLVQTFALSRSTIKVKEDEDFRTASELYDNKWTWQNSFKATDETAYVVLTLPEECDRNRFKITILRKGTRKDLTSDEFLFQAEQGQPRTTRGYEFSPKQIATLGGGPGEYEVKFYSGPEPVMRCTFRINQ
ncbi:MAG: hypothetical protein JXA11_09440 [Phycisphaerae bacterium]|nr:hypothetical protein [Phycisphaerae bacterium]